MPFQHLTHVQDDIDLVGSVLDGHSYFENLHLEKRLRRRKSARNARDTHIRTIDHHTDRFDERRIDADRRHVGKMGKLSVKLDGFAGKFRNRLHGVRTRQRG